MKSIAKIAIGGILMNFTVTNSHCRSEQTDWRVTFGEEGVLVHKPLKCQEPFRALIIPRLRRGRNEVGGKAINQTAITKIQQPARIHELDHSDGHFDWI
jgi:hypothetical protein